MLLFVKTMIRVRNCSWDDINVASSINLHEYQPCNEYLVKNGDGFMKISTTGDVYFIVTTISNMNHSFYK